MTRYNPDGIFDATLNPGGIQPGRAGFNTPALGHVDHSDWVAGELATSVAKDANGKYVVGGIWIYRGGDANGNAVEGVSVTIEFNGVVYDNLTTDSNGTARNSWERNLASGEYYADVHDLALTGFVWNSNLDQEFDSDGDGWADDMLTV